MHSGKLPFNAMVELLVSYIFTLYVGSIIDDEGKKKFPTLVALASYVFTLSHGNADPERGFSINKHLLKIRRSTTSESTIVTLRLVKDFILERVVLSNTLMTI